MISRSSDHENPDSRSVYADSETSVAVFCPRGHRNAGDPHFCNTCAERIYASPGMIQWAHCYNGYKRLARGGPQLMELLHPHREKFAQSGEIPDWAGIDLLRGWAFLLARIDNQQQGGGRTLGREFAAVVDAIDRHPAVFPRERSPLDRGAACSVQVGVEDSALNRA